MTAINTMDKLEKDFQNIETIKGQIIRPKLVQLHPGIEGFESPNNFGVYRHTGGSEEEIIYGSTSSAMIEKAIQYSFAN